MNSTSSLIKPLVVAALLSTAGLSQAAITVYTDLAAFNAATSAQGTDTYTGLTLTNITPSPTTRPAGPYSYTADAAPLGSLFGGGTTANPFLATNSYSDTIIFNAFSAGVAAIGGNFFGSNIAGLFTVGTMRLVGTDSFGAVSTQTINDATTSSFLGFVSTGVMSSLTLCSINMVTGTCGPGSTPFVWPSVDNLVLGKAVAVVPEPSTYAMLLAGLGAVGFVARRRS
jgi:hypothetical protein